jgi:hypothetical protein
MGERCSSYHPFSSVGDVTLPRRPPPLAQQVSSSRRLTVPRLAAGISPHLETRVGDGPQGRTLLLRLGAGGAVGWR